MKSFFEPGRRLFRILFGERLQILSATFLGFFHRYVFRVTKECKFNDQPGKQYNSEAFSTQNYLKNRIKFILFVMPIIISIFSMH